MIATTFVQAGEVIQSDQFTNGVRDAHSPDEPILVGRRDEFFQPGEELPAVDPGRSERLYLVTDAGMRNIGAGPVSFPASWSVVAEEVDRTGAVVDGGETIRFNMSGGASGIVDRVTRVTLV